MAGAVSLGSELLGVESGLVATFFAGRLEPVVYVGSEVPREEYAHVLVTRSIASLAYVPFFNLGRLAGLMEVLAFGASVGMAELEALDDVVELAGPAIVEAGGRVIARGLPLAVKEQGLDQRSLIIEWDSLEQALAVYQGEAYKAALEKLGSTAERDIRILEAVE